MSLSEDSTNFKPPSSWSPSGDIRRDLFQLRSHFYKQIPFDGFSSENPEENTQIYDSMQYILERVVPQDDSGEVSTQNEDTNTEKVEDLSSLPDQDLEKVTVSLSVQNQVLYPQDILALSNALRTCAFRVESVSFLATKLPSIILLAQALRYKKSLKQFCVDMCRIQGATQIAAMHADSPKESIFQTIDEAPLLEDEQWKREEKANQSAKKGKDSPLDVHPPQIQQVQLSNCIFLAPFMTYAKHISLRGYNLNCKDVDTIAKILAMHPLLETLSLWGCNITDEGATSLARSLRTSHSIIGIELGFNKITDVGAEALLQVFQPIEVTGIETLQEMRMNAYKSVYGEVFESPDKLPVAQDLIPVLLGPKGKPGKSIYQVIEWDENIKVLSSPDPVSGKKGEVALQNPSIFQVPGNRILRFLGLSGNIKITNATAQILPKYTKGATQFEKVALTNTSISETGLEVALSTLNEVIEEDASLS